MKITLSCPTCHLLQPAPEGQNGEVKCKNDHSYSYKISDVMKNEGLWDHCPVCSSFDAFIQKDVSKNLYLVVFIFFMLIILYLLSVSWILGVASLFSLTLIDFVLFKILPPVLVCYGCGTQARDYSNTKTLKAFDHHVGENYRKASRSV